MTVPQKEILQFLINRYINLLKEYIIKKNHSSKGEDSFHHSYLLMKIGRFREYEFDLLSDSIVWDLYSHLISEDYDIIEKKIKINYFENLWDDTVKTLKDESIFMEYVCAPYIEPPLKDDYEINEENTKIHENFSAREDDILKSLIVPRIKKNIDITKHEISIDNPKSTCNILSSDNLNSHIEDLIENNLSHHIDKLGDNGVIHKEQIYNKYGVTPILDSSERKVAEYIANLDEDMKSFESKLTLPQVIIISFFLFIKYRSKDDKYTKDIDSSALYQIIVHPTSQKNVPKSFVKDIIKLIEEYSEETTLSNNEHGNTDSDLKLLIESYLISRIGIRNFNQYNNFLKFIIRIKVNLEKLITDQTDFTSQFNLDTLTFDFQSCYNKWIKSIEPDDSARNYTKIFNDISKLHDSLSLSKDDLNDLDKELQSSNDSMIKTRFDIINQRTK